MAYGRPGVYTTERLLPAPLAGTATTTAAGACIGAFARGPVTVTRITSWYEFTRLFGGYDIAYPATFGVGMFFQNGGTELYVRRVLGSYTSFAGVTITDGTDDVVTFTAVTPGYDGNNLRVQLTRRGTTSYYDLVVYRENGTDPSTTDDIVLEQYNNVVIDDANSADYIESVVNVSSPYVDVAVVDGSLIPVGTLAPLTGATEDVAPEATDYTDALVDFEIIERPLVIFAPEVTRLLSSADSSTVQSGLISWAETNNSFAVCDTPADLPVTSEGDTVLDYSESLTTSSYGAVYYPQLYMVDPFGRTTSSVRKVGPAGAVAGLYLATDRQFGPFKTPAGLRTSLGGAITTERRFTSSELDTLNTPLKPVNAIRDIPGAGVVVMGGRTLKQDGTANRYVSMRRSLIYLRRELESITQFALFENNDENLWARIRTVLAVFLNGYRNQGGLAGAGPEEAFFVTCDRTNNTVDTVANGEVHIEVGVALEYPAEFVVITLSQKTAA